MPRFEQDTGYLLKQETARRARAPKVIHLFNQAAKKDSGRIERPQFRADPQVCGQLKNPAAGFSRQNY